MKLLWIVNIIFPYAAEKLGISSTYYGGWMVSLASDISKHKEVDLAIASIYNGKEIQRFSQDGVIYYLIPGGTKSMLSYNANLEYFWREVVKDFTPNLVHIHGTEYAHGLAFVKALPEIPVVVSIQGLLSAYEKVYYGGLDLKTLIFGRTLRDNIKRDGLIEQRHKFRKRAEYERDLLGRVKHVIGRTSWDFAHVKSINRAVIYHHCYESLRDEFYQNQWDIASMERYTIFVSQASYPIKGLHFLLEALSFVKTVFPDVKLYVAGPNIIDISTIKSRLKITGYGKYLLNLIKQYDLFHHVVFTGPLNANEMANRMKRSHVFVLPSVIENSPNSLGEAMIMGVPSIAAYVGGVPDMVEDQKNCLFYPATEAAMLAQHIMNVFSDDQLALQLSKYGHEVARKKHDRQFNYQRMINIYKDIIGGNSSC